MGETRDRAAEPGWTAPMVSPEWLAAHLPEPTLRVLDIRSAVDGGGYDAFAGGHVPGAVYSDYTRDGWRAARGVVTGLLPEPDALARLFGRLGISPAHHVVVVGAGNGPADFSAAARVYWTLKTAGHGAASILAGGMVAWSADPARPLESGAGARPTPVAHPVVIDPAWRSDLAAVAAALDSRTAMLLDSRALAFFRGEKKSPQADRAGRLPGAVPLDHTHAFDASGRLRTEEELAILFDMPQGHVIHYCNTGHQAAANWFIMSELLCRAGATLFDGSMAEWTEDRKRPVAVG